MCKFKVFGYIAMHAQEPRNANQVVVWLLWHVYSDPELLAEVRHEVDRYIKVISPKSELPIAEPERLDMNIEGLRRSCPLLKASYFETMRLDVQATTYRTVTADFTVTESPEDAAIAGMSKPQTYKVPKGQYVCVPHSVHQRDDRYFKDPTAFNPKRFYVIDKEKPDEITVDMGSMHPFGGGSNMCKGKAIPLQCELPSHLHQLTREPRAEFCRKRSLSFCCSYPRNLGYRASRG
jgi:cytochrome P450